MSQGKQIYYHNLRENIRNMNPKFKELAIKAGAYEDNGTILTGPMDTAKFAELIVAECANEILKWKSEPFPFDPEFAAKLLKDHFEIK